MKRKVIKQGNNTLTITLPKQWTEQAGIKAGDEVDLEPGRNGMFISAQGVVKGGTATINIESEDGFNMNMLSALYTMGVDSIQVSYPTAKVHEKIATRLRDLTGYEIMRQSKGQCTIHSISNLDEEEFKPMLRRAFLVTIEMARSISDAMHSHDYTQLQTARNLEKVNNRLTDHCRRMAWRGRSDGYHPIATWVLLTLLEMIGDQYKYICDFYGRRKLKVSREALALYDETTALLEDFHAAFFDMDIKSISGVYNKGRRIHQRAIELFERKPSEDMYLLRNIISITNNVYELNIQMLQLYMDAKRTLG